MKRARAEPENDTESIVRLERVRKTVFQFDSKGAREDRSTAEGEAARERPYRVVSTVISCDEEAFRSGLIALLHEPAARRHS